SLEPRHLAAPGFVLVLAGALVTAPRRPLVAATVLAPYLAALLGASAIVAARVRDPRAATRLPLAFLAMHLGWGLGLWAGSVAASVMVIGPKVVNRMVSALQPRKTGRSPLNRDRPGERSRAAEADGSVSRPVVPGGM